MHVCMYAGMSIWFYLRQGFEAMDAWFELNCGGVWGEVCTHALYTLSYLPALETFIVCLVLEKIGADLIFHLSQAGLNGNEYIDWIG